MIPEATKPECCPVYEKMPCYDECFYAEIRDEIKQLEQRHCCMFTKRKRILEMAVPRHAAERFVPRCPCQLQKPVQIVRLYEPMHTRTEQLAFPSPRRLLLFKERVRKLFDPQRMEVVTRLTRLSLLSLYSRLANLQPPEPKKPIKKWDEKEWKKHRKYLKQLAKPKKLLKPPKVPVKRMSLKAMKRYKKLARPKKYPVDMPPVWVFTPAMKFYEPTERILTLSTPRFTAELKQDKSGAISPAALQYKASKRIKTLSQPAEKRTIEPDIRDDAFVISPNALKAKASKRIIDLAEPREYENKHIRENPNLISPAALKCKASPRIIQLAKPKGT